MLQSCEHDEHGYSADLAFDFNSFVCGSDGINAPVVPIRALVFPQARRAIGGEAE